MVLSQAKRIVIKIGSSLVANGGSDLLHGLAADIKKQDCEFIIVSSGAVALGKTKLYLQGDLSLEQKQAAFTTGQIELMQLYKQSFSNIGQILLTLEDTENRRRYLNLQNTIENMLSLSLTPIINENDAVLTQELRYGDNDRLSARVAQMVGADYLILLSDVDGLYNKAPTLDDAKLFKVIDNITEIHEDAAGESTTNVGTGGMRTKLDAARLCINAGINCIITKGEASIIGNLFNGTAKHTLFASKVNKLSARQNWILAGVNPKGTLVIDNGAANALRNGNSLLPAGVANITGEFERGDLLDITSIDGVSIGKGLSTYNSIDAGKISGKQSADIANVLGYNGRTELVHADNLVLN